MAQIKIVSVAGRDVTVDVTWANGWQRTFVVPNTPVEDFAQSYEHMKTYIESMYSGVAQEEAAKAYANPTVAPEVLASIGHTFDDAGNVVS